ncbi:DMT family transporter [Streptomyces sp. NBC_00335]|uniref:DMT family transporter n=1 Tax=unclassified Streptomyces TaxID=2593676 RepID=UPI002251779F|nr:MULTISPECIES: DMT family transporter [unclassified Streptomyces]MCX5405895.1 DMT family transporter [Streptomyces sp. NBC_00086]
MISAGRVGVLALLWGSTFLWIDLALEGLTPVQVTLARCALGALVLGVACRFARQRLPTGRVVWGHVLVAAFFCNALPFALFSVGQQSVDSGLAGVLNATTPLWSLLIGLVTRAERRPRAIRVAGLLVGLAGTALIFAPWQRSGQVGWGALAILGAAASYAFAFTYMGRHLVGKGVPTLSLATTQLLAATGLTTLALPFGGLTAVRLQAAPLPAVVVLGVFATGVTFYLTYRIIADEGATNAATVGYLLPVVSVLLGALVLGEEPGPRVIAGMAVVLLGVALTRRRATVVTEGKRSKPRPDDRTAPAAATGGHPR